MPESVGARFESVGEPVLRVARAFADARAHIRELAFRVFGKIVRAVGELVFRAAREIARAIRHTTGLTGIGRAAEARTADAAGAISGRTGQVAAVAVATARVRATRVVLHRHILQE